jgi:RNA polymerase sigma-70 factor (ECF subfamily)
MQELEPRILRRCQAGDPRAFAALATFYLPRVYGLCVALGGSEGDDLTQETFVRVHAALPELVPDGAPVGAWIMRIARNLCIDHARARAVRLRAVADAPHALRVDAPDHAVIAAVRAAVLNLPDELRAVIVLREWAELDYEAIATIEGLPVGTVRSRLSRARAQLRRTLAPAADEAQEDEDHDVRRA